jgi:hypothetical protein
MVLCKDGDSVAWDGDVCQFWIGLHTLFILFFLDCGNFASQSLPFLPFYSQHPLGGFRDLTHEQVIDRDIYFLDEAEGSKGYTRGAAVVLDMAFLSEKSHVLFAYDNVNCFEAGLAVYVLDDVYLLRVFSNNHSSENLLDPWLSCSDGHRSCCQSRISDLRIHAREKSLS